MSDIPPYRPDPTRDASGDTIGDAADESVESAESAEESATADVAADPGTPADPADLPTVGSAPEGVTAYDTTFGLQPAPPSSWVPQRAGGRAAPTPPPPPATRPSDVVGPRTITLPPAATRSLGGRLQAWHVVAIMVGLLVPVGFWAASSLAEDLDPLARPTVSITRHRPSVTRPIAVPTPVTTVPGQRPSGQGATKTVPAVPRPTRSVVTSPPKVVTVPAIPVTPVPANARTIRFETYAENGARIEVSLSDATHQRIDFPVQAAPLAFEAPVDPGATSNDYYSLRVRISDPTGSGVRGAVSCRILVDGIVVTTQQGQRYATCSISPYFDIKRR